MRFRIHLTNPAIFAMLWIALSALVLHDIALRRAALSPNITGVAVSEKVVTKEFVLVDDSGQTRARIGMNDKTNAPCVQLFDAGGQQRAQLRLNKDDVPSLRLYDNSGNLKSVMGFTLNDMNPSYVTFDSAGVGHVENTTRSNAAFLRIRDEDLMSQYVTSAKPIFQSSEMPYQSMSEANLQVNLQQQQANIDAARAQAEAVQAQVEALQAQTEAVKRDPFHPFYHGTR
jgi:hypothetical protein